MKTEKEIKEKISILSGKVYAINRNARPTIAALKWVLEDD